MLAAVPVNAALCRLVRGYLLVANPDLWGFCGDARNLTAQLPMPRPASLMPGAAAQRRAGPSGMGKSSAHGLDRNGDWRA